MDFALRDREIHVARNMHTAKSFAQATRFEELTEQLTNPAVLGDGAALSRITKERSRLEPVAQQYAKVVALENALQEARAALDDPNWPVHARHVLQSGDDSYSAWPIQAGYAVKNKDRSLKQRSFAE